MICDAILAYSTHAIYEARTHSSSSEMATASIEKAAAASRSEVYKLHTYPASVYFLEVRECKRQMKDKRPTRPSIKISKCEKEKCVCCAVCTS